MAKEKFDRSKAHVNIGTMDQCHKQENTSYYLVK